MRTKRTIELKHERLLSGGFAVAMIAVLSVLGGCLGEPEIDDRWTKVEMVNVAPGPAETQPAGQAFDVAVNGRITYRKIVTGFLVAEMRYSDTITPDQVALDPERHNETNAAQIDMILANSVTMGRATRAVTGFDHLMQDINLSFTTSAPAAMFPGGTGPAVGGMYLLLYMGDGDEIELQDGRDSLVVTPFVSGDREILHTGFEFQITPPGGTP
jgi:hypothetical protein